jgi:hypothetical protein
MIDTGLPESISSAAPAGSAPAGPAIPYFGVAPPPPPRPFAGTINYFRFCPAVAGWTSVASFGTASVWHRGRDILAQQHVVCRMVADPSSKSDTQRIELMVMASEAEWPGTCSATESRKCPGPILRRLAALRWFAVARVLRRHRLGGRRLCRIGFFGNRHPRDSACSRRPYTLSRGRRDASPPYARSYPCIRSMNRDNPRPTPLL